MFQRFLQGADFQFETIITFSSPFINLIVDNIMHHSKMLSPGKNKSLTSSAILFYFHVYETDADTSPSSLRESGFGIGE
jgi:hypothetical protein